MTLTSGAQLSCAPLSILSVVQSALQNKQIVGLGEAHWYFSIFEQLQQLIINPQLNAYVNDVVIEFGNQQHQALLDDYLAGEAVSEQQLNIVWLDSIAFPAWASPHFMHFFKRVRSANQQRPTPLRIHLVEQAHQWSRLTNPLAVMQANAQRDQDLFEYVEQHFVSQQKAAIVLFGARHLLKQTVPAKPIIKIKPVHQSFGMLMQQAYPNTLLSCWPHIAAQQTRIHALLPKSQTPYALHTQHSSIGQLSFNDISPKPAFLNLGSHTPLSTLFDVYLNFGHQQRELKPQALRLSAEQWQIINQRIPHLNPRQQALMQQVKACSLGAVKA